MAESRHSLPSYREKGYWGQCDINVKLSIDQHKRIKWNVCVLKPNKWFKHHTMLFECVTTSDKFTVELLAGSEVVFRCWSFDTSNPRYSQLRKEVLGVCTASVHSLIATAISVLKQQGDYHETCNNCQVRIRTDAACVWLVYHKCVQECKTFPIWIYRWKIKKIHHTTQYLWLLWWKGLFCTSLQDYCKALAKTLDCNDYWGDREKAEVMGEALLLQLLLLDLQFCWLLPWFWFVVKITHVIRFFSPSVVKLLLSLCFHNNFIW